MHTVALRIYSHVSIRIFGFVSIFFLWSSAAIDIVTSDATSPPPTIAQSRFSFIEQSASSALLVPA